MIPLRDTIPSSRFPLITTGIICVNVLVFIGELTLSGYQLQDFFQTWGLVPRRFTQARLEPHYSAFLVSIFLHGNWMHIIGNMWSLWIFGDNVEDRMGRGGFLCFYLLSGLAAGVLHVMTNPNSGVPTVGASGAIAGVMGAYLLLFPHSTVVTLVPIFFFLQIVELPAVLFLIVWFLINVYSGLGSLTDGAASGGVAWWAHIGGFLVGVLWALPLRRRLGKQRGQRYDAFDNERW
jgi:membrane associated rhomboid family serine protease